MPGPSIAQGPASGFTGLERRGTALQHEIRLRRCETRVCRPVGLSGVKKREARCLHGLDGELTGGLPREERGPSGQALLACDAVGSDAQYACLRNKDLESRGQWPSRLWRDTAGAGGVWRAAALCGHVDRRLCYKAHSIHAISSEKSRAFFSPHTSSSLCSRLPVCGVGQGR